MKLITFAIPSYNSQDYLERCVRSLLPGGERVEILIINDGSTDGTGAIADALQQENPGIVRAIHKKNGGHGSAVNRGSDEARGLYYKVVDSDDWVNREALLKLLDTAAGHLEDGTLPDLYITNFIYDHTQDNTRFLRHWRRHLRPGVLTDWNSLGRFTGSQVLLMHSLMYRTELLRQSDTRLPEHTFYVDNYYAYKPLPLMKSIYYLDVDLYHYFIGRDDQSVNEKNFVRRYDQQLRVMRCMTDAYSYEQICGMVPPLKRYMLHCLSAIMINTMMFCCAGGSEPERIAAHDALWDHIRRQDPQMYRFFRRRSMPALLIRLPWKLRGRLMRFGYHVLCRVVKLG